MPGAAPRCSLKSRQQNRFPLWRVLFWRPSGRNGTGACRGVNYLYKLTATGRTVGVVLVIGAVAVALGPLVQIVLDPVVEAVLDHHLGDDTVDGSPGLKMDRRRLCLLL